MYSESTQHSLGRLEAAVHRPYNDTYLITSSNHREKVCVDMYLGGPPRVAGRSLGQVQRSGHAAPGKGKKVTNTREKKAEVERRKEGCVL